MTCNQVVRAGMTAVGTTLKVNLDIQAVRDAGPAQAPIPGRNT